MDLSKIKFDKLDAENAKVLVDLVVHPFTSDALRVQILTKLAEGAESDNFFDTIFSEDLDLGECPDCGHRSHWLIPENDLNQRGWVSREQDPRVLATTDIITCPQWQESCNKKKITI